MALPFIDASSEVSWAAVGAIVVTRYGSIVAVEIAATIAVTMFVLAGFTPKSGDAVLAGVPTDGVGNGTTVGVTGVASPGIATTVGVALAGVGTGVALGVVSTGRVAGEVG